MTSTLLHNLKPDIRVTFRLAYPVMIGQLGHMMMGVVDSIMVGRLGPTPLAAAALANSLFFLILVIGLGITYAITPLVAMAVGRQRPGECGTVLRQGLLVCLVTAGVLALVILGISRLLPWLNQPAGVTAAVPPYLRILGLSIVPVMVFQVYRQFSEGVSQMIPPMIITIAANVVNAFFNWILIFGHFGLPAMGLVGSGWSTLISRCCMAVALVVFVLKARRYRVYHPDFHYRTVDWSIIRRLLKLGLGSGFQNFFEVGAFAGAAVMIGWLGTDALAAHQIALNLAALTFMCAVGVSAASSIRVGNAMGMKDRQAVRRAGFAALVSAGGMMMIFGVLFVLLRHVLPTLYIDNPRVIEIAASLLIVAALFQMSDGIQVAGLGILRGMEDAKIPTLITFAAYWVIGLPGGYLLGFRLGWGVQGVWVGLMLSLTASAIMLSWRFARNVRSLPAGSAVTPS